MVHTQERLELIALELAETSKDNRELREELHKQYEQINVLREALANAKSNSAISAMSERMEELRKANDKLHKREEELMGTIIEHENTIAALQSKLAKLTSHKTNKTK